MLLSNLFSNFISGYLTVAGAMIFGGGILLLVSRLRLWLFGARASGEVISYTPRMQSSRAEALSYMPTIQYQAADGTKHRFQSRTSCDPARRPVGTIVTVLFMADQPEKAEISGGYQLWLAPASMLLFGLLLFYAADKAAG